MYVHKTCERQVYTIMGHDKNMNGYDHQNCRLLYNHELSLSPEDKTRQAANLSHTIHCCAFRLHTDGIPH